MLAAPADPAVTRALAPPDAWTWLAVGALVVVAAIAVSLWLRRRARRGPPARRRAGPRYPVVLAHGLLGFDELRIGRARADYFRGVPARLEREGCVVHRCRVPKTASVADRAAELARFVDDLPARRVNVVAHSMGGLDARFAISRLGLGRKVASLVTIGTPHLGTPLADACAGLGRRAGLWDGLERVGMNVDALDDLTRERMEAFNRAVPDARGVLYGSVVGAPSRKRDVSPILLPTFLWLGASGGENDGMVPAASQRWGELVWDVEADHFAQIGWSRRFDAVELYAALLRELRGRGV